MPKLVLKWKILCFFPLLFWSNQCKLLLSNIQRDLILSICTHNVTFNWQFSLIVCIYNVNKVFSERLFFSSCFAGQAVSEDENSTVQHAYYYRTWKENFLPPATSPDSPNWIATPKPPSFTGAEFSFEASSTQCGWKDKNPDKLLYYLRNTICIPELVFINWQTGTRIFYFFLNNFLISDTFFCPGLLFLHWLHFQLSQAQQNPIRTPEEHKVK